MEVSDTVLSLLDYDLLGFQTIRDRRNFIQCVRTLIKDISVQGRGDVLRLRFRERNVRVGVFPDGMNLVAKEYCASSLEENCVLILSEFTGAAGQFQKGALLVNPHDKEGVADAIYRAVNMLEDERRQRMRKLRASVKKQDIYWWVDSFLHAAIAKPLDNFPIIEEYVPQMDLR